MISRSTLFLLTLSLLAGCTGDRSAEVAELPEGYHQQLQEWKEYRIDVLKGPTNWLRLVDIAWLPNGEATIGSAPDVDVQFPERALPPAAGVIESAGDNVELTAAQSSGMQMDGQDISGQTVTIHDDDGNAPEITSGDFIWFADRRGDEIGLRMYDQSLERADQFDGFPFYEVNPEWYKAAQFIPYDAPKPIAIANVLGDMVERESPGYIEFSVDGESVTLDVFEANSGLFIMFTDHTNRTDTYQAGRYLIIDFPNEEGRTVADFNRTYNPPCAFNTFTVCQLPPPQNRLPFAIEAGEQRPPNMWKGLDGKKFVASDSPD
ncbi:MAG: DUF1684 domain-containing protein [Balneolaceae bacterium]